ncbi:AAA family ATPase [Rapidithrix thailandica]|uniref:AAA family ATPase n=1 Tax=Rapidithrix thailandica TaxID=413964 RepID=A0AAW9S4R5_9BACT
MIKSYRNLGRRFQFYNPEKIEGRQNIFTVIVGKNGSGKSTLLGSLVRDLLGVQNSKKLYKGPELGFEHIEKGKVVTTKKPKEIISVSTSPFDKFPFVRHSLAVSNYSYLGLRDLHGSNFGLAYLSKIIASLIQSVFENPTTAIGKVLNYLGYHDIISIRFDLSMTKGMLEDLVYYLNDNSQDFPRRRGSLRRLNMRYFCNEEDEVDLAKVEYLIQVAERIFNHKIPKLFELEINSRGFEMNHFDMKLSEDLILLIQSGMIRLRDVGIRSLEDSRLFSIRDASSGEQSVILSILGIASAIRDYSVICIDEPEICLHPQWQERYIQLLISTFSSFKSCHFIIATHSPQIISRLNARNCFIMTMEDGHAFDAKGYIKHSADFQLAKLFDSPGYKNEFLSRIALNIFSKVSKNKSFDKEDLQNLELLKYQSNFLDKKDPVYELIGSINELFQIYG